MPITSVLVLLPLVLIYFVPQLNFARYSPLPDWWSSALALALASLAMVAAAWQIRRDTARQLQVPWFLPGFLLWWLLLWLVSLWRYQQAGGGMLPFELFGVLYTALAASLVAGLAAKHGQERVLAWLAWGMVIGAVLQASIGVIQLCNLAPMAQGWVVVVDPASDMRVLGNIGQRNQLAHVLSWGAVALAYLWSRRRLVWWLALPLLVLFALCAAWSGGRLPIAYAASLLVFGLLWLARDRRSRMGAAVLVAALVLLLFQFTGKYFAFWLTGVDSIQSGLDRFDQAAFGARRYIEWQKSLLVVQQYPWLGTGVGGFAYQSLWLETFAGLGKVPESALFTHSHNLLTQLLAETGIPATLLAAAVVCRCLLPYLSPRHASEEGLFMVSLAAIILVHSLFEYPLWYLPFSFAFFVVLALAPVAPVTLALRASLRRMGALLLASLCLLYLWSGAAAFRLLTQHPAPARDIRLNQQHIVELAELALNPFWRFEAELVLSNYLLPSPSQLALKLHYYETLTTYRPYPVLLCKLAMLQAWGGQTGKAEQNLRLALVYFPHEVLAMQRIVGASTDPRLRPLQQRLQGAAEAYRAGGAQGVIAHLTSGVAKQPPRLPTFR